MLLKREIVFNGVKLKDLIDQGRGKGVEALVEDVQVLFLRVVDHDLRGTEIVLFVHDAKNDIGIDTGIVGVLQGLEQRFADDKAVDLKQRGLIVATREGPTKKTYMT